MASMIRKASPKPTIKATPKSKVASKPKFIPPTLGDFKKSAGYKTNSMTYKDYVATAKQVFDAKNKNR